MIVLLIHEQPAQLTGSDCCGKIEGKYTDFHIEPLFEDTRKSLEKAEILMTKIRTSFQDVEIHQIDSRNIFGLWMMLWKYRKRLKLTLMHKIKLFLLFFRVPCMIIDGHYFELDNPAIELELDEFLKKYKEDTGETHG